MISPQRIFLPYCIILYLPPIPPDIIPIFNNISVEQTKDKKIQEIISILNSNSISSWTQYYTLKNNILFYRRFKYDTNWSLYIPSPLVKQVILLFHEYYAHVGPLKTAHNIKNISYLPSLNKVVRDVVQQCELCQWCEPKTTRIAGPMQPILSKKPLDKLLVDFYGPLPTGMFQFAYIFVIVDNFTRFVKLYPLRQANSKICIKKLTTDYFPTYGIPQNIVLDHGRQFISKRHSKNITFK